MGLKEPNLEKWKKIGELELRDDDWERVKLFIDLLTVRTNLLLNVKYYNLTVTTVVRDFNSMQIKLNKHFHPTKTQVFISQFQLSKHYIKYGAQDSKDQNMLAFKHHSRLQ